MFFKKSSGGSGHKGPKVKTGPTRGSVRSRTSKGTWRAKRSDTGKSRRK